MSRRPLTVALALGLLLAACARQNPEVEFGSGKRFVPQVADALDDVGLGASVVVDPNGTPYVAYFGFAGPVTPGELVTGRPIGAPSLPGVMLTSAKDGIWTRGAVAMEKAITNVDVAFGPAEVPEVVSMTPENVSGTAMAVDANGKLHVAWAADTGLWYASNAGSTVFTASRLHELATPLTTAGPLGAPGIAVDAQGVPWVAYTLTTGLGKEVTVATPDGDAWRIEVAATIPLGTSGTRPPRTAVALTGDGTAVVAYADGTGVVAATRGDDGWTLATVEDGADGSGLSAATGPDGSVWVAYYAGAEIHVATSADGGATWQTASAGPVGEASAVAGLSTGIDVDGNGAAYVAWYDPAADSVMAASGTSAGGFVPLPLTDTDGGAAPSVAVTADGSTVYVAWYDRAAQDLMLGAYTEASAFEVAVQSPTPTGAPTQAAPPPSQECEKVKDGEITVVSQGIAFLTTCIETPAGEAFTIHFQNEDAAPHNIQVFPGPTAEGSPINEAELITGPGAAVDYVIDPLDEGEYFFNCLVHPNMIGKILAKGAKK